MSASAAPPAHEVHYPESDGKPMSDNTRQLDWILKFVGNFRVLVRDMQDVFAGGNQNWYPRQWHPEICQAPDAYVVFGRPKGHRSSWKQWEEDDTPLTVVVEVLSPGNSYREMADKQAFYDDYGVEEYYIYDPESNFLEAFRRGGTSLLRVRGDIDGYASPRLGVSFDLSGPELIVRYPDGRPFLAMEELDRVAAAANERAERADERAERAECRAERAECRAARLAELTQKLLSQQISGEEMAELRALLSPPV